MQKGIVVTDVTVTYRNGHTALRDASFSVPGGSIAALVGVNGSGKSTLFKAVMGFVRAASGTISILGLPPHRALRLNLVAYVPQSEEVDWSFPVLVEDVVMMGRYGHMGFLRRPKERDRQIVTDALKRVDMLELRHRQIGELSGGQKKRVSGEGDCPAGRGDPARRAVYRRGRQNRSQDHQPAAGVARRG